MIELEVYNNRVEALGIIKKWNFLRWRKQYFDTGEFEIRCEAIKDNLEIIKEGNFVTRLDDDYVAVIENVSIQSLSDGIVITASGRFLTKVLEERITLETYNFNETPYLVVKRLLDENIINPTDSIRRIENVVLTPFYDVTENVKFQLGLGNTLLNSIYKMCKVTNLSIKGTLDYESKKVVFNLWKGKELQDNVVFSDEDGNIQNVKYENITSNYKNFALIAGAGEGKERKRITIDGGQKGWERKEFFVDARDIQDKEFKDDEEIQITPEKYNELLLARGKEKLSERENFTNFTAETTESVNDKYKRDWTLGDIVTVYSTKWNIELINRVTEVEEIVENGIIKVYPTFGTPLPELKDILKEELY